MRYCVLFFFLPLLTLLAPSCETVHDAAVASFKVVDAPHAYVRRKLGIEEEQTTTTTTTTTTETNVPPNGQGVPPPPPPPPGQAGVAATTSTMPPPPVQPFETQRRTTVKEEEAEAQSRPKPSATPRVAASGSASSATRRSESKPSPPPKTVSSQKTDIPYAKPVPGKPGFVFSPFDPNGGYVDVKGIAPGTKVKDPYSGKIFLVP